MKRSDMPGDAKLHFGRLVSYVGKTGRPFVGVLVACPKCKRTHRFDWRWDWGLSPDVVSYQELRCPRAQRRLWVALDPAAESENAAVHQAAHAAYEAWQAERAARKAARASEAEPRTPDPTEER